MSKTPHSIDRDEQAKMKKEADATKSAFAIMTPEEKAAPKKATDSEHQSTRTPS